MILADLEAIKRRCEAATPGPWTTLGAVVADGSSCLDDRARNAEFIAHAREDVPALLEAVERLLSMLTDAQTEAEMQAERARRLLVCAEWARLHIDEEWPDGPTGDTENWRRFVAVLDRDAGPLPEPWAK